MAALRASSSTRFLASASAAALAWACKQHTHASDDPALQQEGRKVFGDDAKAEDQFSVSAGVPLACPNDRRDGAGTLEGAQTWAAWRCSWAACCWNCCTCI